MDERQKMIEALKSNVIPQLRTNGFKGTFPHFKRSFTDRVELLVFQWNKYGGSFTVEISVIFPSGNDPNYYKISDNETIDKINVYSTSKRYRLDGYFDGWFYYTDVYRSIIKSNLFKKIYHYQSATEKQKKRFEFDDSWELVQKADDHIYNTVTDIVNQQLKSAYTWWSKYDTSDKLKGYKK
jgi:hypothetical protein